MGMRGRVVGCVAGLAMSACALPSAMPAPDRVAPRRVSFARRVTLPAFRYDAERETPAGVVAGRVLDDSTGLPVRVSAAAWLTERPDSTSGNAWGQFELGALAPGRYTLVTTAPGYEPRLDVIDVKGDDGTAVEIRLRRANALTVARALPGKGSAPRVVVAGGAQGF